MDTWINDKTCQQDLAKLEEEEFNDESKFISLLAILSIFSHA